jgi:hypothetical protein
MPPEMEQIANGLRLAKLYWRRTIQPYIAGRRLRDAELYLAEVAYESLRRAAEKAVEWNNSEAGKLSPISAESLDEMHAEDLRRPERLYAEANLKPESLAMIAGQFIKKQESDLSNAEAVQVAHELLFAAETYVNGLPKPGLRMGEVFGWALSIINFDQVSASNRKDSGHVPLLLPVQQGRNGGRLSLGAFKAALKKFMEEHRPDAGYANDCVAYGQIRLGDLCKLRWERFRDWNEQQHVRVAMRKSSAAVKMGAKSKAASTSVKASRGKQ